MCVLAQVQGDQPASKALRCPISVLSHTLPPLCQPRVLTAQRLCVTGGDTGCASLSFALCSRELRCCRKWGSSEVMVSIARRALHFMSCLPHFFHFPGKQQAGPLLCCGRRWRICLFRLPFHQAFPSPPGRGHREATWGLVSSSLIPRRPVLQTAAQTGLVHNPSVDSLTLFSTLPYSHSKSMNMAPAQCKGEAEHFFGNNKAFHW